MVTEKKRRRKSEETKKIEKREEAIAKGNEEEVGMLGGFLAGLGGMFPGLGGFLKGLEESPAFKERLKNVGKEIEAKIKQAPLKRTEARGSSLRMGIPPGVRSKEVQRRHFVKEGSERIRPKSPPPAPKDPPVEVFDEKDYITVVAEMPGVEQNRITVELEKDNLTISADTPGREYRQRLKLPCEPTGELKKSYKNGILEVKIKK